MALVGICIIAPGFGGMIPVRPALMADYFGTTHFGTLNGIAQLANTTGGAIGPLVVGILVDVTGSYSEGWLVCAVVAALSIPIFLALRPPTALAELYRGTAPPAAPVAH
jgi:MFS family permease